MGEASGHRVRPVVAPEEPEPHEMDGVLLAPEAGADCHDFVAELATRTRTAAGDLDRALALARELGAGLAAPGVGQTRSRWSALATLGAVDLTVARVAEPHLDALAILAESGQPELADAGLTLHLGRVRRRRRHCPPACAAGPKS